MDKRDQQDKEDKRRIEEYKKKPMINFADSVNRSMMGDIGGLAKGGFLNKIITIIVIAVLLFLASRCSN